MHIAAHASTRRVSHAERPAVNDRILCVYVCDRVFLVFPLGSLRPLVHARTRILCRSLRIFPALRKPSRAYEIHSRRRGQPQHTLASARTQNTTHTHMCAYACAHTHTQISHRHTVAHAYAHTHGSRGRARAVSVASNFIMKIE